MIEQILSFLNGLLSLILFSGSAILGTLAVYSFISIGEHVNTILDNEITSETFLFVLIFVSMILVSVIQLLSAVVVLFVSVGDFNDNILSVFPYKSSFLLGICCILMTTVNNQYLTDVLESKTFGLLFDSFQTVEDTDEAEDPDSECDLLPVNNTVVESIPYTTVENILSLIRYGRIAFIVIGLLFMLSSAFASAFNRKSMTNERNNWTFDRSRWYTKSKIYTSRHLFSIILQKLSFLPMLVYAIVSSILLKADFVRSVSISILCSIIILNGFRSRITHSVDIFGVYFCFLWAIIYMEHRTFNYTAVLFAMLLLPPAVFVATYIRTPKFFIAYFKNEIRDSVYWWKKITRRILTIKKLKLDEHPLNSIFIVAGLFGLICFSMALFLPLYNLDIQSGSLINEITDEIDDAADDIDDLIASLTGTVARFDPCYRGLQFGDTVISHRDWQAFAKVKEELEMLGVDSRDAEIEVNIPSANTMFDNSYIQEINQQCEDEYILPIRERKCKKRLSILAQQSLDVRDNNGNPFECIDSSLVPVFDETCRKAVCAGFLSALVSTYALLFVPFVGTVAAPIQMSLRTLKSTFKLGKRFLRKVRKLASNRKRYRKVVKIFKRIRNKFSQNNDRINTVFTLTKQSLVMLLPSIVIGAFTFNVGFWSRRITGGISQQFISTLCIACSVANTVLSLVLFISEDVFSNTLQKLPSSLFVFKIESELGLQLLKAGLILTTVSGFWFSLVFRLKKVDVDSFIVYDNVTYKLGNMLIATLFIIPTLYIISVNIWPIAETPSVIFDFKASENKDLNDVRDGAKDMEQVGITLTEVRDDSEDINNACDLVERAIEVIVKSTLGKIAAAFTEAKENVVNRISGSINNLIDKLNICNGRVCTLGGAIDIIQNLILFAPPLVISLTIVSLTFMTAFSKRMQDIMDFLLAFSIGILFSGLVTLLGVYGLFSLFDGVKLPFFDLVVVTSNGFYISLLCYLLCSLSLISVVIGFTLELL